MTTRTIAEMLAATAAGFEPLLGPVTAADLLALVTGELGHEEALDRFCIHHSNARTAPPGQRVTHFTRALPPAAILHLFETAAPQTAIHSLIRGLLLGAHNLCLTPPDGIPELAAFREALPPELRGEVEISAQLPPHWHETAGAVVAHGSDDFLAAARARLKPGQIFLPKRRRLAFGVIFEDSIYETPPAVARDVSLFDQHSPFSPHVIYVAETGHLDPRTYARQLATAMEEFDRRQPRRPLGPRAAALINSLRASYRFRASNDRKTTAIWESQNSTNWTVIYEADPSFSVSCLNRLVFVKPLPRSLHITLSDVRSQLGTAAIHPATHDNAALLARLGVTRVCPFGRLHTPLATWHDDGGQSLAPLVRWLDYEQPAK